MNLCRLSTLAVLAFIPVAAGLSVAAEAPIAAPDIEPATKMIPAGSYIRGSTPAGREYGYRLDEQAYGHSVTREGRWYAGEFPREQRHLPGYRITVTPITNAQYGAFVAATGHRVPDVDQATWKSYGLIYPWSRTRRHAWSGRSVPDGRQKHPVVLVSRADAQAYAGWLSRRTGRRWRLPTEDRWEKAARGPDGHRFPWGNEFDPGLLNSHDGGPFDTLPVGRYPAGASAFGVLDMAGQVFEWTETLAGNRGQAVVKGGSWDDKGCGVCRAAARHSRPEGLKHILIGFRLVTDSLAGTSR